jgi:hypothetical protein
MSDFYITLPSDSSYKYFLDNTVARYKTKLHTPFCMNDGYEGALTELIFPMNYSNVYVPGDDMSIGIELVDQETNNAEALCSFLLKNKYFANAAKLKQHMDRMLTKTINDSLSRAAEAATNSSSTSRVKVSPISSVYASFNFLSDRDDERVPFITIVDSRGVNLNNFFQFNYSYSFKKRFSLIEIRDEHGNNLGYSMNKLVELNKGVRLMYVYTDIIEYGIVGDVIAPLLRVVIPRGERDEAVSTTFSKPYYLPVSQCDINAIEISINNELGMSMPFTSGKSASVLHFRKRNHLI